MYRRKGKFIRKKKLDRVEKVSQLTTRRNINSSNIDENHNYVLSDHTYSECVPDLSLLSSDTAVYEETSSSGLSGRMVIELDFLAKELSCCKNCNTALHLHNCVKKTNVGLASTLDIFCPNCEMISVIGTGKKHGNIYDVNTKIGTALVHSGIGVAQLNSLLGCLNLPTVSHTLINRRLRETGKVIEEVANETLENALQEEAGTDGEAEVSVDAGWQKRGSGRSYDSLSGHCTMIRCKTGKVVGYAVRSKTCRFCENAERYGYDPKSHECKKNWCGSSKAMEPDMVVEMVRKVQEKGIKTVSLIGDEDAATISLVRAKVDRSIKKKSDRNHIRKTVSSLLYGLQKKNKSFSVRCIKYIMKLFSYMLSTYANDREGMIEGLQALCCHPFGDHSHCDKWCDKKSNPKKMYASLPFGKPLSDTIIQNDLREIFHSYIKHADKLSCLGSTQANESLNKTIASKAPKHLHLSGSANLNYRIAAGIAQKNAGQRYLIDVHRKIGISPGTFMMKLVTLRDLQARKRRAVATTHKAKRRRMLLKQKRNQNRATCEVKEGPSYSSNIELNDEARHGNIPEGVTITQEICCVPKDHTPVFFDLETTGLSNFILQALYLK